MLVFGYRISLLRVRVVTIAPPAVDTMIVVINSAERNFLLAVDRCNPVGTEVDVGHPKCVPGGNFFNGGCVIIAHVSHNASKGAQSAFVLAQTPRATKRAYTAAVRDAVREITSLVVDG